MPESRPPFLRRYWPPPPETPEVRKEQAKLTSGALNAGAIACLATGFVGPFITTIPDEDLSVFTRAFLICLGTVLHLAARLSLRYINERGDDD